MKTRTLTALSGTAAATALLIGSAFTPGTAAVAPTGARTDRVTVTAGERVVVKPITNDRIPGKRRATFRVLKTDNDISARQKGKRLIIRTDGTTAADVYVITYRVVSVSAGRRFTDTARIKVEVRAASAPTISTVPAPVTTSVAPTTSVPSDPTTSAPPTPGSDTTPLPSPDPTTTQPPQPPASNSAAAMINALPVAAEVRTGYDRATWNHWNSGSAGISYCNTRNEVLISESIVTPTWSGTACTITGQWYSYYDGVTWTNPSDLDIDHMVALAEAHDSGGYAWDAATKEAYANDQGDSRSLVAVTDNVNQSKGDQDPGEWWPLLERCRYLGEWVAVKHRWDLNIDQIEKDALLLQADQCSGMTITVIER